MLEDFEIQVDEKTLSRREDFYEVCIRIDRKTEGVTGVRAMDVWVYLPREQGDRLTWSEIVASAQIHAREFFDSAARTQ